MNSGVHNFKELRPRIIVMGVGGAGGNAVNNMIASGLEGVEFVAANTDAQALSMSGADMRFQLGVNLTEGLGAGSNPEIGEGAAEEVIEEMRSLMEGAHMIFVACGMGGGTGTGAAPVVARVAQEMGVLTVAVVTKPFHFEGQRRMRIAEAGIEQLRKYVDTMIVIPNQNLFRLANEQTTFSDSFQLADQVLNSGVACVTDLIMKEGLINLDFADVKTVITEMGAAVMGTGLAQGEGRARKAAEEAISNPLIDDISLSGAKGLLISISGGPDMTLFEVDEVAGRIRGEVDPDANIIVGATFDDNLEGYLRVSLVASGLNHAHPQSMHEEADRLRMEQDAEKELQNNVAGLNDRLQELEHNRLSGGGIAEPGADRYGGPNGQRVRPVYNAGSVGAPHSGNAQVGRSSGGVAQGKGQVQIKNKPPRFMTDAGDSATRAPVVPSAAVDDVSSGRDFVAGAPQAIQRPMRRMPRVDELPITGQNQMRAYEAPAESHGIVAQKKKVGFFDRITGRNRQAETVSPTGTPAREPHGQEPVVSDSRNVQRKDMGVEEPKNTGFRDAHGQIPPSPTPVKVQQAPVHPAVPVQPAVPAIQTAVQIETAEPHAQKPAVEVRNVEGPLDEWQVHHPETLGERYPTVEIHKPVLSDSAFGDDDDEPIADIPPFLRKNNK